jgi:hypothetical protein
MSSVWNWVVDYRWQRSVGDDGYRMYNLFNSALQCHESDPRVALTNLDAARDIAQRLEEPWWVLLCDHWRIQTLIHSLGDYIAARDIAARSVVEARKPAYAQFPQRICLQEDLISVYIAHDPHGHAAGIEDALAYMEREAAPGADCGLCLLGLKIWFALEREDLQQAEAEAGNFLSAAEEYKVRSGSEHYLANCYTDFCDISFRRCDWPALLEWATIGEAPARRLDKRQLVAKYLAWQALASRKLGHDEAASRLYRSATAISGRLGLPPSGDYCNALSAYQEAAGDLPRALKLRDRELEAIAGKGHIDRECRIHRERCRLLRLMGRLSERDLAAARTAAAQLVDPARYLATLEVAG